MRSLKIVAWCSLVVGAVVSISLELSLGKRREERRREEDGNTFDVFK